MANTAKNAELTVRWPLAPTQVRLNTDTELLKLVAMLTMLCDHAGKMLFSQYAFMRLIGRIAFPIYACCIAIGSVYTKNALNYVKRIVLVALISQPIYAVSMAHTVQAMYAVPFSENPVKCVLNFYIESWAHPNILVTLALGVMLIWALRNRQIVLAIALGVFCWLIQSKLDYGIRGIGLMLLFYLFCSYRWLSLPVVLAFMVWWGLRGSGYSLFGVQFSSQMFAVLALPLIYVHTNSKLRLPKWVFYVFYPAHLLLILLLNTFVF